LLHWCKIRYCFPYAELGITDDSRRGDVVEASLFEEMVAALTEEGGIDPQVVRAEALRLYLNMHPALKLDGAVALWRTNRISLARAAEIAGITVPELKEVLAARGIVRETEGKSHAEMDATLHKLLP
jgi:predicted HTH domain antitoxin